MEPNGPGPGSLADEKYGGTTNTGDPQPDAPEVESARLLANDAREELERHGLDADRVRRLADEYIALDLGEDAGGFVRWALERSEPHA